LKTNNCEKSEIETPIFAHQLTAMAKTDLFESPDYYQLDELLSDEHKLIRATVRDWVKKK